MTKRNALLIWAVMLSLSAMAQKVKLQMYVSPESAWIRLNGEVIPPAPDRTLPIVREVTPGQQVVEVWMEMLTLEKDTIQVPASEKPFVYRKGLRIRDKEYAKASRKANMQQVKAIALYTGVAAQVGLTGYLGIQAFAGDFGVTDKKNRLTDIENVYKDALTLEQLADYKLAHAEALTIYQDAQKKRNLARSVGIPVAVASAVGSYFLIRYLIKHKPKIDKPTPKNPFVLTPMFESSGLLTHNIGLKIQF